MQYMGRFTDNVYKTFIPSYFWKNVFYRNYNKILASPINNSYFSNKSLYFKLLL